MDGQGCWRDNIFVERRWRTVKYEEDYLHVYATVSEARAGLDRYLTRYTRAAATRASPITPPTRHTSSPCGRHFGWPRNRPSPYRATLVSLSKKAKPLLNGGLRT